MIRIQIDITEGDHEAHIRLRNFPTPDATSGEIGQAKLIQECIREVQRQFILRAADAGKIKRAVFLERQL